MTEIFKMYSKLRHVRIPFSKVNFRQKYFMFLERDDSRHAAHAANSEISVYMFPLKRVVFFFFWSAPAWHSGELSVSLKIWVKENVMENVKRFNER